MAIKVSNTTSGNWSATSWGTVSNTPTLHASTNITLAAGDKLSATFTAPAVDGSTASVGCMFYVATWSTATTITVALQEDSGAGFVDVATKTITLASIDTKWNTGWIYAKWASAYIYAVGTANKYRYAFRRDTGSPTVAADSGGTLVAFMDIDNVSTAPASTDNVFIIGANEATTQTITLDTTSTCGDSTTNIPSSTRTLTYALIIDKNGSLTWATGASIDLNVNGAMYVAGGGTLNIGSTSNPISWAYTDRIIFTVNAKGASTWGLAVADYGTCVMQGSPLYTTPSLSSSNVISNQSFYTTFSSGLGTAASPLIITALKTLSGVSTSIASPCVVTYTGHGLNTDTPIMLTTTGALPTGLSANTQYYVKKIDADTFTLATSPGGADINTSGTQSGTHTLDVNWVVNDELVFAAATDATWDRTEYKFIKTVNSATSYVLSATAGGAESALSYTHTAAKICNLRRNVQVTTDSTSYGSSLVFYAHTTSGYVNVDWVASYRMGQVSNRAASWTILNNTNVDYSVAYPSDNTTARQQLGFDFGYGPNGTEGIQVANTYTGLVACRYTSGTEKTGNGFIIWATSSQTFNYCFSFHNYIAGIGFYDSGSSYGSASMASVSNTFNYCHFVGNGAYGGGTGRWGNIITKVGTQFNTFNYCESHSTPEAGIGMLASSGNTFNNCLFGTKGTNGADFINYQNCYYDNMFYNCTFGSATLVKSVQYRLMTAGSKVRFFQHNTTAGKMLVYTPQGQIISTGTGLTDTTAHTTGGYALRFAPETALSPYLTWSFKVPTGNIQNKTMSIVVWCYINNSAYWAGSYQYPRLTVNYDNGTTTYTEATATAGSWQPITITFTPLTTWAEITVTLSAATDATTTNAYVYFDDMSIFYPTGTSMNLGAMDYFSGDTAFPVTPPIATTLGGADAAVAIWTMPTTNLVTPGSIGERLARSKITG